MDGRKGGSWTLITDWEISYLYEYLKGKQTWDERIWGKVPVRWETP